MSKLTDEMQEVFRDSFMQPKAYLGIDIQDQVLDSGLDLEDDKYYCRLSADGFMDQTDLSGPFDSIDECAAHLIDTYGSE